jgi:mRNA-degrading endonuclease RelE of RelBE toxin-antitoxin system
MKILRTDAFKEDYKRLPKSTQKKFEDKIRLFINDFNHPSLRVKKMKGHKDRWEAGIDMFYRFTFKIHQDYYLLRRIGPHDAVLKKS